MPQPLSGLPQGQCLERVPGPAAAAARAGPGREKQQVRAGPRRAPPGCAAAPGPAVFPASGPRARAERAHLERGRAAGPRLLGIPSRGRLRGARAGAAAPRGGRAPPSRPRRPAAPPCGPQPSGGGLCPAPRALFVFLARLT